MKPVSNQPRRIYATTKMHNFDLLDDIRVANLKFRPILYQAEAYVYNAAEGIIMTSNPFSENEYKIKGS